MAKNPQDKKRTRHIQIRFHWIREQLENGILTLIPTKTLNQLADLFAKGMHGPQLKTISAKLGLIQDSVKQRGSEIVNRWFTESNIIYKWLWRHPSEYKRSMQILDKEVAI